MASTYLTRSKSSPTSDKKGTISFWIKRSKITQEQAIIVSGSGSIDSNIYFNGSTDKLHVYDYQSGAFNFEYITTRVFRDTSAWYAITVEIDTTLATASDRVKIYINGVRETVFDTATTPNQNITPLFFTSANPFYIGAYRGSSGYFNGLLSHFHYTDGYAYGASTFGSIDSTTGEWKINTSPSITMGTNGFTILKDGNTITDQSSNSNDFTLGGGTLTKTEDCPSNVFCTMSPIDKSGLNAGYSTLTNGNTRQDTVSVTQNSGSRSTLAVNSGKWYVEAKAFGSASPEFRRIGILGMDSSTWMTATNSALTSHAEGYAYKSSGDKGNNGNEVSYGSSYTNGDIVGIAFDADNGTIWFSKNGTWQNSATTTEIQNGTTTNSAYSSIPMTRFYGFACTLAGATSNMGFEWNFGNGYFGTTAISSEGTNASGIGKFEYDVPTGYTALSTKGLNE